MANKVDIDNLNQELDLLNDDIASRASEIRSYLQNIDNIELITIFEKLLLDFRKNLNTFYSDICRVEKENKGKQL